MKQKVVYAVILVLFVIFLGMCFTYDNRLSARFPSIAFGVGIVLCIMKLLALLNPKIGKVLDPEGLLEDQGKNIASVQENIASLDTDALEDGIIKSTDGADQRSAADRAKREFLVVGWCIMAVVCIWLFGFYIASAVMAFLFIKFIGDRSIVPSTLISIAVPVVLYFGFKMALKIQLYNGVLF